jgi:glycosyltransferase involved in cell wall biosynthesis
MTVLILCHDFPPLNSIAARRPYSWFNFFPKSNIHPVVVTKSWEYSSATVDEIAAQQGASEIIIDEQESRTLIKVPLHRILPEKLLARYGVAKFSLLRKTLTFLYLIFSYPFFFFDKNQMIFHAADDYLRQHRADFIIATGEPFILFKHAHLLSRKYHIPWIADFRDGWFLNPEVTRRKGMAIKLLRRWELFFEKKYISSCKFITTVDPMLASKLSMLHSKKTNVIYNGFEEFSPVNMNHESDNLPLILCHSGTLYPGHYAEILLQAVHDLDLTEKISPADLRIKFIGIEFFPLQYQRVMQYSPQTAQYLETSKRLSQKEVKQLNSGADFLIVFSDRWEPVIPAKTYEYLASRRPVVVILNDRSILSNLISELNAGIVIDSIEDLKKFLLEKIGAKRNHRPLFNYQLDEAKASFYMRESQAAQLALLLK